MKLLLAGLLFIFTASSAVAQDPRPGVAVDSKGGQVIDPTKNVLDLVNAESKYQDAMRLAEAKYQNSLREADARRLNDLRESDTRRLNELREAEVRRLNDLAAQKKEFDLELARVIQTNTNSSTLLLATQVKELKTDSSERMAKLEQFRWESGGRGTGQGDLVGWAFLGLGILVAAVGLFYRRPLPASKAP